jgi:hypothetical protein
MSEVAACIIKTREIKPITRMGYMKIVPIIAMFAVAVFLYCNGDREQLTKQPDTIQPVETSVDTQSITTIKKPIMRQPYTNSHPIPLKPDSVDSAK